MYDEMILLDIEKDPRVCVSNDKPMHLFILVFKKVIIDWEIIPND